MDSDSAARSPAPPFCVTHGDDGRLTSTTTCACSTSDAPQTGVRRLVASYTGIAGASDAVRPLAPKRLRRPDRRSRVLVVDDEPMMCELVGFMLEPRFEVLCLSSGREALAKLRAGERFDVVLSDLMMPEVSGIDLFRVLVHEQPALAKRMIFMTGGTFTELMDRFLEEVGAAPLMKPFGRELVYERVNAQLARLA